MKIDNVIIEARNGRTVMDPITFKWALDVEGEGLKAIFEAVHTALNKKLCWCDRNGIRISRKLSDAIWGMDHENTTGDHAIDGDTFHIGFDGADYSFTIRGNIA